MNNNDAPTPAEIPAAAVGEKAATYNEQALADRCIDFLEDRADEWMEDGGVQRMFNAIASVFEKYAPQEIMDRFREKLGVIGRQCHVEGALRVWEEISDQQRALGLPLPDIAAALPTPSEGLTERYREALEKIAEKDGDGFEMLTPQAMQHVARAVLGGKGDRL